MAKLVNPDLIVTNETKLNDTNLSKSKENVNSGHHYPDDILAESNKNRHIRILVKNIDIMDSIEKLVKGATEVVNKNLEIMASLAHGKIPTLKEQKDLSNRMNTLVECNTIYGIALPLPNELNDSQSHDWEETTGVATDAVEAGVAVASSLGGVFSDILFGPTRGAKVADAAGKGLSLGLKAANQVMSKTGFRKPLVNPGYFQDYKGTKPRSFSFSWDFVPNNSKEAIQIFNIIYNLKKFTLPTSTLAGTALLSPYLFEIQVGNNVINSMMNMNNLVCKSMDLNYSADNTLQMFTDGMPKHITLKMEFAERSLITADMY